MEYAENEACAEGKDSLKQNEIKNKLRLAN